MIERSSAGGMILSAYAYHNGELVCKPVTVKPIRPFLCLVISLT